MSHSAPEPNRPMTAADRPDPRAADQAHHAAFFRQSTWMMFATVASGVLMFLVHFFSKKIPEAEYGILGTLLAVLNCVTIPALPLQMVVAHQTAAAITDLEHRQLAGLSRAVWLGTFVTWAVMALGVGIWHRELLAQLKIANPAALWVMVLVALTSLWFPLFCGLLQGKQNFLWYGWAMMLNGAGRLAAVAVIVLLLGGYAAGILTGALIGYVAALAVCIWHSRRVWRGPSAPFDWRAWLAKVVPLVFGFGACQFLFSADPIFVQLFFDKEKTGFYVAAGTLARALIWFVLPLAAVMFPKIVHSTARSEKTNVMGLTLLLTGVLVACGALGLGLIAPWLIRLVFKTTYLAESVPLLPWFAASMVPLALANVLVNNLMARSQFRAVPWLVAVAVAYGVTLYFRHDSFKMVVQILGSFNLLLLAVCAWFTWSRKTAPVEPASALPPAENI